MIGSCPRVSENPVQPRKKRGGAALEDVRTQGPVWTNVEQWGVFDAGTVQLA